MNWFDILKSLNGGFLVAESIDVILESIYNDLDSCEDAELLGDELLKVEKLQKDGYKWFISLDTVVIDYDTPSKWFKDDNLESACENIAKSYFQKGVEQ